MTKHIIIAGVPRAGKSTVSQMVAKKFGYQHISMDSIIAGFELLKQHDTPKDYTYYKPEEENRKDCAEIVEISKYYKEQCEKFQLPYYETAQNREKVLGDFIKQLEDKSK